MGNPGVSKSWFQWYIMYSLVNEKVFPTLGRNYMNSTKPPEVIIRHEGDSQIFFYFPRCEKVFSMAYHTKHILEFFKPDTALYLMEPANSLIEPTFCELQTIISCSPDRRRYKEFFKRGAQVRYMPCWSLDELKLVGAHIAKTHGDHNFYSPEAVERRYNQFGGIITYVIPLKEHVLYLAENEQRNAIAEASPLKVMEPGIGIEKRENKKNISHFLMKYDVKYGGEYVGDIKEFTQFDMTIISKFVEKDMKKKAWGMNNVELETALTTQLMFIEELPPNYSMFEILIGEVLVRSGKFFAMEKYGLNIPGTSRILSI